MVADRRFLPAAILLTFFLFFCFSSLPSPLSDPNFIPIASPTSNISPVQETRPSIPTPQSHEVEVVPVRVSPTPKCSVTKVSMLYGAHVFPELIDAVDSHRQHSERWGCGFAKLDFELTNRRHFSKQYFILSHILQEMAKPVEQRKEWIMWADADSIVVNPDISPEAFLPPSELKDIYALMTADHNGLNDGLFYLRVSYASVDLLTRVTDYNFANPNEDLGWLGEQVAMQRVIEKIETEARAASKPTGIAWVPREWFNTYQFDGDAGFEGKPGHHIVHFAGLAETRLTLMNGWLQRLKNDQERWKIPISETFYHKAIPEFWEEFAANTSHVSR